MKTAVFYDLENMDLPLKNGDSERQLVTLMDKIKMNELVGSVTLQRAYLSKSNNAVAHIAPVLKKYGIDLVEVAPLVENPKRKKSNLVDFKMTVDIVSAIATKRSIETVSIASGDNDFGFLAEKVKDLGKNLLVIATPNTIGESMLQLCDDWIDPSGKVNLAKFIQRAIEKRIALDYTGGDFMDSLGDFLQRLERDLFIRRCMTEVGLQFSVFINILRRYGLEFPPYGKLGFHNINSFLTLALRNAKFRIEGDFIRYHPEGVPPTIDQLSVGLLALPGGYTREKFLRYYDLLLGIENADEFMGYIQFMKRCGVLHNQKLCPKRTYRAVIRRNLTKKMASAGIELERSTLTKINRLL